MKVIFSSRHSSNQIKNDTPTLTDVLPPKPSKTVNRKIGQQRRRDNKRKQRILGGKMRVESMKSKVILCEEINKNTEELETKHTCKKNELILAHDKEIKKLTDAHADQVKKLRRKQYYLNQKNKEYTDKINDGDVSFFMNKCLHRTRSKEKRATFVLNMVVSGEMFGQKGKQAGQKFVRIQCRKHIQLGDCVSQKILTTKAASTSKV